MARMYSHRRGKSGSKKPAKKTIPAWLTYKAKDVELLISKLAKEGKSPSEIGTVLRDTYGIPSVKTVCGGGVAKIMQKNNLAPEIPQDLAALIKRLAIVTKHKSANPKDEKGKRGIMLTESKINRLVKYYKRTGKLATDWKLDMTRLGYFAQ